MTNPTHKGVTIGGADIAVTPGMWSLKDPKTLSNTSTD